MTTELEEGTVYEIIEDNNQDTVPVTLLELPEQTVLQDLEICDVIPSLNFDLTQGVVQADSQALLSFYEVCWRCYHKSKCY